MITTGIEVGIHNHTVLTFTNFCSLITLSFSRLSIIQAVIQQILENRLGESLNYLLKTFSDFFPNFH